MILADCISDFSTSYGLPVSLFLVGLVGGFSHCTFMCAPFVLAQVNSSSLGMKRLRSVMLWPYHLGRMTTYVGLAMVLGGAVNVAFLFSPVKALVSAPLLMLAAVLFLISTFPKLAFLFPWAGRFRVMNLSKLFSPILSKFLDDPGVMRRYGLGVLLGFMPCGLVASALLASSAKGNMIESGIAMAAFAFGTMPSLILVGFGGNILTRKYPSLQARLSQSAVVVSSIWLFILAGQMIF